MPREIHHFETAYGPLLAKWAPILGEAHMKELVADMSPAIQSLIKGDMAEMAAAGADRKHLAVMETSIKNYEAWRASKGL